MIYYGEIPFLYQVFTPTNVRSVKEKGSYQVVSRLSLLHPNTLGLTPARRPVKAYSNNKLSSTRCSSTTQRGLNSVCRRFLPQ